MSNCVIPQCGPFGNTTKGPRTVIVPADPIIWDSQKSYEYLTLVASSDFGQGYIAKKDVPSGTPLTDTDYWIPVAQFNAQLASISTELENAADAVYSIYSFDGETLEDKLFNALDTISEGVILCGPITITKKYSSVSGKDYRRIAINNATISLNVNNWFDQTASLHHSVPAFTNCSINGNGYTFFENGTCVGPFFTNCRMRSVTIFNDEKNYIQSPYFIGCDMNPIGNLITADTVFDLKIIGCKVESSQGVFIKIVSKSQGIVQGSIDSSLIEGRTDTVIECGAAISLSITNCYFEANNGGLINQTGRSANAIINVKNNAFFSPMNSTDYAITVNSTAFNNVSIINNFTNYPSGKYLYNHYNTNAPVTLMPHLRNVSSANARMFPNDPANTDMRFYFGSNSASWNEDDSAWEIKYAFKNEEFYSSARPFYIVFAGSYSNSVVYQGFAILRCTPRTYYNSSSSNVEAICDVEVIDGANTNSHTKNKSGITASAELSSVSTGGIGTIVTIKISGFSKSRGTYAMIDPFALFRGNVVSYN